MDIFGAYAKHEQEKEDIIKEIMERVLNGDNNFTIILNDDFSEEEARYIEEEIMRRLEKGDNYCY